MATYYPASDNQTEASPVMCVSESMVDETPVIPPNMTVYGTPYPPPSNLDCDAWNQTRPLSLTLGNLIPSHIQFPPPNFDISSFFIPNIQVENHGGGFAGEYVHESVRFDRSLYGMSNSKYLKAAQQLLDEIASVKNVSIHQTKHVIPNLQESSPDVVSPSEKQELQNKLSKLLSMLEEVGRRYKQYHHQMQIVVSSFDTVAGHGSAKPYTAVALRTISRHFRRLYDAVTGQIRTIRRSLGEEEISTNDKGVGISRLRYVDRHLRQQRALQQLGMMQQHTWRSQRGLPESSVSILRAWLFEHFLHPYPKDSDKVMLARQTGLTRNQVSNWFINARVRLWKPMVEEMYKEEIGEVELDSISSSENTSKATRDPSEIPRLITATSGCQNGCELYSDAMVYQMPELGRGDSRVSLTLGLHGHNGANHGLVNDMYAASGSSSGTEVSGYFDCLDDGNRQQQHRYSPSHLMRDFVA